MPCGLVVLGKKYSQIGVVSVCVLFCVLPLSK